jgi:hypothetical protein
MARNHISPIEYKTAHFLITDRPSDAIIEDYVKVRTLPRARWDGVRTYTDSPSLWSPTQVLKAQDVAAVVRVCEPSYSTAPLEKAGITVYVRVLPARHLGLLKIPGPIMGGMHAAGACRIGSFKMVPRHRRM